MNINLNPITKNEIKHLPYLYPLKEYDGKEWMAAVTLTYKYVPRDRSFSNHFLRLMYEIGVVNACEHRRLNWIMRVEGGHSNASGSTVHAGEEQSHIHALIGRSRVENGFYAPFLFCDLASFIADTWEHGITYVEPYYEEKQWLEYTLKCPFGPDSPEYEDTVYMSPSLWRYVKDKKTSDDMPNPPDIYLNEAYEDTA
jgi:hypothetical protein